MLAFAFGHFAKPTIRPSAAIAPPPASTVPSTVAATTVPPTAATTAVTTPAAPTTTVRVSVPPITATLGEPAATAPRSAATPATATATTSIAPTSTSTSPAPHIVERTAVGTVSHDGSGSPLPAVLTVALVAIIGAGTAVMLRARRRRAA